MKAAAAVAVVAVAAACGADASTGPPGHFAIGLERVRIVAADGSGAHDLDLRPATDGLLEPDLSRDGKTIVYGARRGIYVARTRGGRARFVRVRLAPWQDLSYSHPSISPDAKRVALGTDAAVYVVSLGDGAIERILVEADGAAEVDWAADADRLAYVTGTRPNRVAGPIVVARSDGGERQRVAIGEDPALSPDGEEVAFTRWVRRGGIVRAGVFVVAIDGGRPRRVAPGFASRPAWSPDGRWIAYMRVVGCGHAICTERLQVVPADGGRPRNVTPPLLFDTPQYSWGG